MWFKNITIFNMNGGKKYTEEELETILGAERFVPCGEMDLIKTGWDTVFEEDAEDKLVRSVGQAFFFKLRTEKKVIPSGVVKDKLKERVAKYRAENEDRKPSKTEKEQMKETIMMDMARTAFTESKYIEGYMDYASNLLVVNAGSAAKSDEFTSALRVALGSLEVAPLDVDDVSDKLSGWMVNNSRPAEFDIGISCDLKDLDGGMISVKKHEVDVEEITQHLSNGKNVVKLELVWQKRVRFSLTNKFEIKSIKPEDIVKENITEDIGDSKDQYNTFQANMLMMTADFAEMINDLVHGM